MIRNFLARAVWYNNRIKEAAARLGMPMLAPLPEATAEEVAEMALSVIQEN